MPGSGPLLMDPVVALCLGRDAAAARVTSVTLELAPPTFKT